MPQRLLEKQLFFFFFFFFFPKAKVCVQCEKKVVFDIPGMEDFAIALVNSLLNLSDRQVKFLGEMESKVIHNC